MSQLLSKDKNFESVYQRISSEVLHARWEVVRSINTAMVRAYWNIGREIVQEELKGKRRAGYGEELVSNLAKRLTSEFGKGFTITNLKYMRLFYSQFSDGRIGHTVCDEFKPELSWSHYRLLTKVESNTARSFYEREAISSNWSVRELDRQINSLLFERLAKSKDKAGLLKLAQKGHEIQTPADIIKDPTILEFLDLPEAHQLVESKLEDALIGRLQDFLLELGKGFAFVARQKRITLDGDHFYCDLVFYHAVLKCYVLIDLKVKKLTHGDLGQMLHYVNHFDNECLSEGDNPTIGLILCIQKNDTMVKYTLGEKQKQIFASKYQFHLPSEKELEIELKKELKALEGKVGK